MAGTLERPQGRAAPSFEPIDEAAFAALMARFVPFERAPVLAVGLSGGGDSLCLVHLAHRWARTAGGHAVALIVDHGLRPESTAEAARAAGWMAEAGIDHHVLSAPAASPQGNLQATARARRLAVMEAWCREAGILHLLLAHHREDQAETLLQRLARGSGAHGLAAITPDKTFRDVRVLRPLLDMPKARLEATLAARGLRWVEDPSNRDPRFDRVRLRHALAVLSADDTLLTERLAHTAGAMRRTRRILDRQIDHLLACAVTLSPLGYAVLDPRGIDGADRDLAARALGLVVAAVGAAPHPPRRESMLRWLRLIARPAGGGATLGGAQLARWRDRWVIGREPAAAAAPITVRPGESARWDNRFDCTLGREAKAAIEIGKPGDLGPRGNSENDSKASGAIAGFQDVPPAARAALPVIRVLDGPCFVPHLNAGRKGQSAVYWAASVTFSPIRPLTDPVSPGGRVWIGV